MPWPPTLGALRARIMEDLALTMARNYDTQDNETYTYLMNSPVGEMSAIMICTAFRRCSEGITRARSA